LDAVFLGDDCPSADLFDIVSQVSYSIERLYFMAFLSELVGPEKFWELDGIPRGH
jgi:hypothetical protein